MRIVNEKTRRTQRSITCKNLNWHKAEELAEKSSRSLSAVIDELLEDISTKEDQNENITKSSALLCTEEPVRLSHEWENTRRQRLG